MEQQLKYGKREHPNVPIDVADYIPEEWERIGIEPKSRNGLIRVAVHKVEGQEREKLCFHTVCSFYDSEKQENSAIIEVLRQKWDTGGYYLRPDSRDRKEMGPGFDPSIGRLP